MDDFTVNVKLIVQTCYTCSIVFAIPEIFGTYRRDDGKGFHCPNGHVLYWPGFESRSDLKDQLDTVNAEKSALKNCNTGLLSKLDQVEALLTVHGLMKTEEEETEETVDPPPAPPLAPREIKTPTEITTEEAAETEDG